MDRPNTSSRKPIAGHPSRSAYISTRQAISVANISRPGAAGSKCNGRPSPGFRTMRKPSPICTAASARYGSIAATGNRAATAIWQSGSKISIRSSSVSGRETDRWTGTASMTKSIKLPPEHLDPFLLPNAEKDRVNHASHLYRAACHQR